MLSECQPPRWKHASSGMFGSGLIPRSTPVTSILSAATAQPRPAHEVGHASKPTHELSRYTSVTMFIWNRAPAGQRAGPGLTHDTFSRAASGATFIRHRPPLYTNAMEPERTPAATGSKTIETQPTTARYRKRRDSSQGTVARADRER